MKAEEAIAYGLQFEGMVYNLEKMADKMGMSGVFNADMDDLNTAIDILKQLASDMPYRADTIKDWENIPDDKDFD
jgi:hypothetical protein